MMFVICLATVVLLIAVWRLFKILNRKYYILCLCKRVRPVDGSPLESKVVVIPGTTPFGNNFDILQNTPSGVFNYVRNASARARLKQMNYFFYFLMAPMYNVIRAEEAEEIFQSPKLITKNVIYELLWPFLGEGLLISTDQKWHSRRKALTPAFHFNVLQSFLIIFKEECKKLVHILNEKIDTELELNQLIPSFTLNNICETALGVNLDDLAEGKQYRDAIHALESVIVQRLCNPLFYFWLYFYLFGEYGKHVKNLKIAHDFSQNIIKRRRQEFKQQQRHGSDDYGRKKRYAMLDTLLAAEENGQIDHQGICDEVNTFMFEGYDTTSTCLIFTLLMLSIHEDVQERCFEELQQLAGDDIDDLSVFDFNELVYLECVIKESLRMFPSVPFIGRLCTEETVVNGLIMPKDTQINIHIYDIMRDPRHFPQPNEYRPERFLPENTVNRHPFAFVPFSAGQRNCIGQKFAILEIKVLLASILKNFRILPVTRFEDIIFEYGIVLRTQQNIKVKFISRTGNSEK
ncbi:probable cytochrome P450 4ac1 [Drosophila tropicalis]|uniref:probable cytochrome P450 4ac1 n=1 Tax=Drosophila tropicalis TaxID=46794 RepID=UPI0035ABB282